MIDVKRRSLSKLRQPAVFAPVPGARRHSPTKTGRSSQCLFRAFDLRAEFEDGEHAGHLCESLGLSFFGSRELSFAALLIQ